MNQPAKNSKILPNSWQARRFALGGTGLFACLMLVACSSSGSALRGVGASTPAELSQVQADTVVNSRAAEQEELQEGVTMNVATVPSSEVTAYAPDEIPPPPEMATTREEAIDQIRRKAQSLPDEKPHVFDRSRSSVARLTPMEQERLRAEMQETAARNQVATGRTTAESKAAEIRRLRRKARTHYDETLKEIEE